MVRNIKKEVTIVTVETSWCRITMVQVKWQAVGRARRKKSRNKNKAAVQPKRDGEGLSGRFGMPMFMQRPSHGLAFFRPKVIKD